MMKLLNLTSCFVALTTLLLSNNAIAHSSGEHVMSLTQYLQHIMQYADHLAMIFGIAVIAGVAIYKTLTNND